MIRMSRRVALPSLLSLASIISSASAGCAWVL
jgi:hypothetical protein